MIKLIFLYGALPLLVFGIGVKMVSELAVRYPIQFGAILVAVIVSGFIFSYFVRKRDHLRGWRMGACGRDEIYYEEKINDRWERIVIYAEMLTGKAHRLIDISSIRFPDWATNREDEIVRRVKFEYPPNRYEYR
jgi:hypothetical protein